MLKHLLCSTVVTFALANPFCTATPVPLCTSASYHIRNSNSHLRSPATREQMFLGTLPEILLAGHGQTDQSRLSKMIKIQHAVIRINTHQLLDGDRALNERVSRIA